jgi:histidyl-tRNA synthetase
VPAFDLASEARRAGLNVQQELAGRSRKGQLKQAARLGARYVAIFDEEEGIILKDMESGEQEELEATAVVVHVLKGRHLS